MQLQKINRDDPEFIDVVFENAQGATISLGFPACFTTTANSNDGVKATLPVATGHKTFAGVALRDTPNNAKGALARAYGFCGSVRIYAHGTSVTIAAGEALGTGPSSNGFSSTGNTYALGPVLAMEAIGAAINSPGGYAKGFVRAL